MQILKKILIKVIKYPSMLVAKSCTTAQNVPTLGYGLVMIALDLG